jgi:hypothetical protein
LSGSFENLVKNLKQSTLDTLSTIFTTDVLVSFGIPEEYTETSFELIEKLLSELMALQNEENYENEVNAVLALYNFATTGLDEIKDEDIHEFASYAIKSKAIANTLHSVSSSNPFGFEIESEDSRQSLSDSIEKYYAEDVATATDKQKVYDVYTDIARFLGLDNEVELAK